MPTILFKILDRFVILPHQLHFSSDKEKGLFGSSQRKAEHHTLNDMRRWEVGKRTLKVKSTC